MLAEIETEALKLSFLYSLLDHISQIGHPNKLGNPNFVSQYDYACIRNAEVQ